MTINSQFNPIRNPNILILITAKIFEGEMFIIILRTTLLRLSWKIILIFKGIVKGIPGWALWYLGGYIRSLSKFKNTPEAQISCQKRHPYFQKTLTFSS